MTEHAHIYKRPNPIRQNITYDMWRKQSHRFLRYNLNLWEDNDSQLITTDFPVHGYAEI